jgi:hypothetical protein
MRRPSSFQSWRRRQDMHKAKLLGLAILVGFAAAPVLLSSCSRGNVREHEEDLVGSLPFQEIVGRAVPASLRQGASTTSQTTGTSMEQGRAIRHDEYLVQMGLLPAALPGFETRFCQELRKELEKHTALRGSGTGATPYPSAPPGLAPRAPSSFLRTPLTSSTVAASSRPRVQGDLELRRGEWREGGRCQESLLGALGDQLRKGRLHEEEVIASWREPDEE